MTSLSFPQITAHSMPAFISEEPTSRHGGANAGPPEASIPFFERMILGVGGAGSQFHDVRTTCLDRERSRKYTLSLANAAISNERGNLEREEISSVIGAMIRIPSAPFADYLQDQLHYQNTVDDARLKIESRLVELQLMALFSGDLISRSSISDLRATLKTLEFSRKPAIFLLENGNFRIKWQNAHGCQVAVQFLGNQNAQFVIFSKDDRGSMTRTAGVTTIDRLGAQIEANRAARLLA